MKQKLIFINSIVILTIFTLFGCKKTVTKGSDKDFYLKLYNKAQEQKDPYTAISALNAYLLSDSSTNELHDSLAKLYFVTGNYRSGIIVGEKVMKKYPKNDTLLELMGDGYQRLGNYLKAVEVFQNLFNRSGDYKYKYQVATLHFEENKIEECELVIAEILKDGLSQPSIIEMSPEGLYDQVPLEAACYNLKAMIEAQVRRNPAAAMKDFKKALEIYPDFKFAQAAMQKLVEYQQYMNQSPERR
jgi:tetratricopeptide (TPR) repeat protein